MSILVTPEQRFFIFNLRPAGAGVANDRGVHRRVTVPGYAQVPHNLVRVEESFTLCPVK